MKGSVHKLQNADLKDINKQNIDAKIEDNKKFDRELQEKLSDVRNNLNRRNPKAAQKSLKEAIKCEVLN